jgi:hypothetical protein
VYRQERVVRVDGCVTWMKAAVELTRCATRIEVWRANRSVYDSEIAQV